MKRDEQRTSYNDIIEIAEETFREFDQLINTVKVKPKARKQILLAVKRRNVAWKRVCAELAGVSWLGLMRATYSHARKRRRERLKAAGIPAWKRSGWKTAEKRRDYQRLYMRKRRAKKRR